MKMTVPTLVGALVLLAPLIGSAKTPKAIAEPTELIVSTAFDGESSPVRKGTIDGWGAGIGEWWMAGGALHGNEVAEDHHPSSCTWKLEAGDLVIKAQFRLGEASQIAFGCRDTVPPNLHLGRVFITPEAVWVQRMSGIAKTTKAEKLAEQKRRIDPEAWHDLTIEIVGDHYRATIDGEVIEARHERFRDAKGIVALISKGQGAQFRKVEIWHAKPKTP